MKEKPIPIPLENIDDPILREWVRKYREESNKYHAKNPVGRPKKEGTLMSFKLSSDSIDNLNLIKDILNIKKTEAIEQALELYAKALQNYLNAEDEKDEE